MKIMKNGKIVEATAQEIAEMEELTSRNPVSLDIGQRLEKLEAALTALEKLISGILHK